MRKIAANRNFENVNKGRFPGAGQYNIPILTALPYEECDFIGFNYAKSCKNRAEKGIHFFMDDYQFMRLWNMPDYYLPLLMQFKYVMTPDFSTYLDYPLALQIYNHYRKHWLGAYMQSYGLRVIPTISWSNRESFAWCFDGEPVHGAVAVSAVGTQKNPVSKERFLEGYQEMLVRLEPTHIIFYGPVPRECQGNIVPIKAFQEKFTKEVRNGR